MALYIQQLADLSAALVTEKGAVLGLFPDLERAIDACEDWYKLAEIQVIYHTPVNLDAGCSTCAVG